MDEKTERMIIRERFPQLLQGPLRAGVIGDVVVQDSAPTQFHENEYIKDTEAGRNYDEKVAGYHGLGMISHEGQPALLGIGAPAWAPARYLATVRGETRMPSFNFNSLAMCSCPRSDSP